MTYEPTGQGLDPGIARLVEPLDDHNQRLIDNVHPTTWANPEPAERYHLVVIGGGRSYFGKVVKKINALEESIEKVESAINGFNEEDLDNLKGPKIIFLGND